ncbi:hypothetical protein Scep_021788 [Stephania cephalantha]|uniref:Uncharacterized protein n=1 Tax=Stephania cephalantha TaxID=152367 RepID=A0AAP0F4Z1_9MAGN
MGPIVSGARSSDRDLDIISPSSLTRPTSTTHIPTIRRGGPSLSNHTPSSHSDHSGSSSRHGIPSPTMPATPSIASPAPSGRSHKAMGAPARAPQRRNGAPSQPLLQSPFHQLPQQHLRRDEEARPVLYGALMHELRALGVRPDIVTDEAWIRYYYEVTPNDVFLHVHTKDHDGVDSRSVQFHAKLVRRREEHTQATPNQPIDEKQLYYDAAGVCLKGRVCGLGSFARKKRRYAYPVVQRLAQFEAFVQSQLGMSIDFGANTSQAPPPPPPQEHHQQVGMDPACSPQQQHDDDDKDNPDWVNEEHLGDES